MPGRLSVLLGTLQDKVNLTLDFVRCRNLLFQRRSVSDQSKVLISKVAHSLENRYQVITGPKTPTQLAFEDELLAMHTREVEQPCLFAAVLYLQRTRTAVAVEGEVDHWGDIQGDDLREQ